MRVVDQAPLQNLAEDWRLGSKGCYDAVSLTRLQALLKYDFMAFTKGNCKGCLSNPWTQRTSDCSWRRR